MWYLEVHWSRSSGVERFADIEKAAGAKPAVTIQTAVCCTELNSLGHILIGKVVTFSSKGIHPDAVSSFIKDHGDIFGCHGTVIRHSSIYNSSFLVRLDDDGRILDLHDQWFWRLLVHQ